MPLLQFFTGVIRVFALGLTAGLCCLLQLLFVGHCESDRFSCEDNSGFFIPLHFIVGFLFEVSISEGVNGFFTALYFFSGVFQVCYLVRLSLNVRHEGIFSNELDTFPFVSVSELLEFLEIQFFFLTLL